MAMPATSSNTQSQESVESFGWQWTKRTVYDSTATFYRRLFHDMGLWYDHHDDKVVADVGSGNGRHVWALCQLTRARKIISVELADASVRHQRRALQDTRVEIIQGDASQVTFVADFIYLAGVIQHTADPEGVLRNCVRNLAEKGELVVSFYMVTPTTILLEPIRFVTRRLPKRVLWWIAPFLAPIFMVRKAGREMGFRNARHTAYDWFGTHHYQRYFTPSAISLLFQSVGVHPKNVRQIRKGLYRVRKGPFGVDLSDEVMSFGA